MNVSIYAAAMVCACLQRLPCIVNVNVNANNLQAIYDDGAYPATK